MNDRVYDEVDGSHVYVRVKHAYEYFSAHSNKTITFVLNEEYQLLKRTSASWWLVLKEGDATPIYIPASYVEEFKKQDVLPPSTNASATSRTSTTTTDVRPTSSISGIADKKSAPQLKPKPPKLATLVSQEEAILKELDAILDSEDFFAVATDGKKKTPERTESLLRRNIGGGTSTTSVGGNVSVGRSASMLVGSSRGTVNGKVGEKGEKKPEKNDVIEGPDRLILDKVSKEKNLLKELDEKNLNKEQDEKDVSRVSPIKHLSVEDMPGL